MLHKESGLGMVFQHTPSTEQVAKAKSTCEGGQRSGEGEVL